MKKVVIPSIIILIISGIFLSGCSIHPKKHSVSLNISAAASLTNSLKEIKKTYEKLHPDIQLDINFAGSGTLQHQIEQGAPADLFISAGINQMDALSHQNLIDASSRINLLTNHLVLIAKSDFPYPIEQLSEISNPDIFKIAIGAPESVPAGSYAEAALTYAKLWDPIQSKLVLCKDVEQVLHYVETGNVDLGFVYQTDAALSQQVKLVFVPDKTSYPAIIYPMAIVKGSAHQTQTTEFYHYLQSKEAAMQFEKFGFQMVGEK